VTGMTSPNDLMRLSRPPHGLTRPLSAQPPNTSPGVPGTRKNRTCPRCSVPNEAPQCGRSVGGWCSEIPVQAHGDSSFLRGRSVDWWCSEIPVQAHGGSSLLRVARWTGGAQKSQCRLMAVSFLRARSADERCSEVPVQAHGGLLPFLGFIFRLIGCCISFFRVPGVMHRAILRMRVVDLPGLRFPARGRIAICSASAFRVRSGPAM
jgi:hypothetical protein